MALNNATPGFQNAFEYSISGLPFVYNASSSVHIEFHNITKSITILPVSSSASIAFSANAPVQRTFVVPQGVVTELNVRVKEIWLTTSGQTSVFAALTTIPSGSFPNMTPTTWEGI
jgi:hypothetical protein